MSYIFNSGYGVGPPIPLFKEEDIKNEPMLFNCDFEAAWKLGGPITKAFLDALMEEVDVKPQVVDTRSHMLMPGWWPCIPGWHHDDVPRSRPDGQPNYDNPEYRSYHALALVNGDICPTQFAVGECELSEVPLGGTIYKKWHVEVEELCNRGVLNIEDAPSNHIVWFDDRAFHRGQPALKGGWRWFGRASYNTHRKPTNEIRRQVQVYLEFPMEGW